MLRVGKGPQAVRKTQAIQMHYKIQNKSKLLGHNLN